MVGVLTACNKLYLRKETKLKCDNYIISLAVHLDTSRTSNIHRYLSNRFPIKKIHDMLNKTAD